MPSPLQHLLQIIKYITLDESYENDPGLTIDVVPGSERDGLVSIKLHIWHLFALHLEFLCNVDFTVYQDAFNVRMLPVCNNRSSFETVLLLMDFLQSFCIHFLCLG